MIAPRLTTAEVAARLGITPGRVRQLARANLLPTEREETPRGPVLRFRAEDVAAYVPRPQGWAKGRPRKAAAPRAE